MFKLVFINSMGGLFSFRFLYFLLHLDYILLSTIHWFWQIVMQWLYATCWFWPSTKKKISWCTLYLANAVASNVSSTAIWDAHESVAISSLATICFSALHTILEYFSQFKFYLMLKSKHYLPNTFFCTLLDETIV